MKLAMIEAAVQRKGFRIISVAGEGTESDDPTAILMRRMIDAFAEYERLVIGARAKAALEAKALRGESVGQIPYGYDLAEDGKTLAPNTTKQQFIANIRRLRGEGMGMRKIADRLNSQSTPTKGKGRWHLISIQRILNERGIASASANR